MKASSGRHEEAARFSESEMDGHWSTTSSRQWHDELHHERRHNTKGNHSHHHQEQPEIQTNSHTASHTPVHTPTHTPAHTKIEAQQQQQPKDSHLPPFELTHGSLAGKKIILDPGHGGSNFGTLGDKHGAPEKVVTLDIAQKLKPILERAGAQVIMTRDHDQDVPVGARAALSKKTGADLFVSIHCNEGKGVQGALSLYQSSDAVGRGSGPLLDKSTRFAQVMVDSLAKGTGEINKGAHPGSYAGVHSVCVLHHNTVPSTLVEVGFLNGPEGARLRDRRYQQTIAENLARGLDQYASLSGPGHSSKR